MLPAHTTPTHINNCLDHIFLKSNQCALTLILESSITDHFPLLLNVKTSRFSHPAIKSRIKTDYDAVLKDISNTDFEPVMTSRDANFAAEYMVTKISNSIRKHTNTYTVCQSKRNIKPWITPGLIRCIRNRDLMHLKLKKDPNNHILSITYKRYRNFINKLLKNVKRQYLKSLLQNARNNAKSTWNIIKNISNIATSKRKHTSNALLNLCHDPRESVNTINRYFVDIGRNLAAKINTNNIGPTISPPLPGPPNSFGLLEVDEHEIESIILGLRNDCAVGWDTFCIIKDCQKMYRPSPNPFV